MEVVASPSQGRTAAAQCGLFTHKSVPVIFEPPCTFLVLFCGVDSPSLGLGTHFSLPCAFVTVGYHTCHFFPAQLQIIIIIFINKTLPVVMLFSLHKQKRIS